MQSRGDERILAEIRDRIVRALHPEKIILFGSRARGDARPDSDYDLLVVARTDLPLGDRGAVVHEALWDLGISKDVVICTPEDFAAHSTWISSIIHQAVREGRVLYEAA